MYKKLFIDTLFLFIFISLFAFVLGTYLNLFSIPYMRTITQPGTTMYYFDFARYAKNIEQAFTNVDILNLDIPTRTWQTGAWELVSFAQEVANNLACILDWFLFLLNIIIYPIRIIAFILRGVFAILGCPISTTIIDGTTYEPQWFMIAFNTLSAIQIPYV